LRGMVMGAVSDHTMRTRDQNPAPALEQIESAADPPSASVARVITAHRDDIERLCRRYGVRHLALFGSAARADFDSQTSDVDLVAEFGPTDSPARQYFDFKAALEELLGRPVDLVELAALPESRLRRIIARTQVPLYVQAA
jgi:predicted nucleotidyltransferase